MVGRQWEDGLLYGWMAERGRVGLKSWLKTSALKNRSNEINIPPPNEKASGDREKMF